MGRCEAITKAGSRCQGGAMEGSSWCYSHDPALAETRKSNARRGGKTGGRGRSSLTETEEAKKYIRGLVARLLRGEVERDIATSAFQGLNVLARFLELERRIRETEDLLPRLEALEESAEQRQRGGYGYGP